MSLERREIIYKDGDAYRINEQEMEKAILDIKKQIDSGDTVSIECSLLDMTAICSRLENDENEVYASWGKQFWDDTLGFIDKVSKK